MDVPNDKRVALEWSATLFLLPDGSRKNSVTARAATTVKTAMPRLFGQIMATPIAPPTAIVCRIRAEFRSAQ
ncbi:hypothetical protein [Paraburkholderia tuberum]|uniref:hypothetical protein n=1 Tax=Paraburkholderia TaxID=1822464 RepID=UPI0013A68D02|nr:hypothetical protein [Paraburkholderia tuberum]